jgi:Tfp pilus assembly protein PilF
MFRRLRQLFSGLLALLRRRPLATLCLCLLVVIVAAPAAAHGWGLYHYQRAESALNDDHLMEAHDEVACCLMVWPWSARTHLLAARIARHSGALSEAEAQLKECRRLDNGATPDTQLEMVMVRAQRGEVDQVIEGLVYAAEHDKVHRREILEALAWSHVRLFRLLPALGLLNRCLQDDPDDVRALDWRGWVFERLDQQELAIADYEHALKYQPDRNDVRLRLAQIYLSQSDPVQAEPHLRRLEKTQAGRPDFQLAMGECRFLQGREEEARALFDRVLAARPDDPDALLYRGKIELQIGRPEDAETFFRRSIQADPLSIAAQAGLFDSLRGRPGREAEADAVQEKYLRMAAGARRMHELLTGEVESASADPGPAAELGKLYMDAGQDDLAIYWLNTALKRDPSHKPTHALLADYFQKKGDKETAAEHRRAADAKATGG